MSNVTLVTGGTTGIGRSIVEKVLAESKCDNDKIIVNYGNNEKIAEDFKKSLSEKDKKKIILIKAALNNVENMQKLVNEVKETTPKIDWLVLNVGVGSYIPFDDYDYATWQEIMDINVGIPTFLVKEVKDIMAQDGNIIFMGSNAGLVPYSSSIVYGASKAAIMFVAKSLVKIFDDKRVAINSVAPGFIETRWQEGRSDESRERINNKIAAHRFGNPKEVADLCYAILTNDYINGSIYEIHGGYNYY